MFLVCFPEIVKIFFDIFKWLENNLIRLGHQSVSIQRLDLYSLHICNKCAAWSACETLKIGAVVI